MAGAYFPHKIEKKWQKKWMKDGIYEAKNTSKKPKSYILIEFPYPSGYRLHVGHARSYCALDSVARLRRMKGFNVMYPFGWDAFGLPAENYAIKTGTHPSITVAENIKRAKEQAISWGLSFDWSREINSTDPAYYKWTQWIFLQLFKNKLAYRSEIAVNWCPSCKINLANEEVIAGNCERCGHVTERRMQKQWLLKITAYADRLLSDLDTVDYRDDIRQQQTNWIGRKEGINITYKVKGSKHSLTCFTTRPDTNFGATFVVLAPEHKLVSKVTKKAQKSKVEAYLKTVAKKSELERLAERRKKTGVFTGSYAVNPLTGEDMPIYVSDFVLLSFGTGVVVGVPGHDTRDFEFAKEFDLPIKRVVVGTDGAKSAIDCLEEVYEGDGEVINSGFLNGLDTLDAQKKIRDYLEEKGWGKSAITYHLRDWVFSRQHYWGEPIPIIHCPKCGEVAVPDEELPVELPFVENYKPTDTGQSPLAAMTEWVNVSCPQCGGDAQRETDTMPNWAGSSWYFLRYTDAKNDKEFASKAALTKWTPVDWYNGGMEHTTLHLLYSRFWHKFLYDQGLVPTPEPYAKRTSHGNVFGPDGTKMSKSKGNVINPDDYVEPYGADTFRMYMMFIGPFEQNVAWNDSSVMGVRKFLNKTWQLVSDVVESGNTTSEEAVLKVVYKLAKKVESDLETMKFNTAISSMMEAVNSLQAMKKDVGKDAIKILCLAMAPCAPHITEEIWNMLGQKGSIHVASWPEVPRKFLVDETTDIVVQVDGKLRSTLTLPTSKLSDEEFVKQEAISALNVRGIKAVTSETNFVYARKKIINFITKK
jgi:leucyl-tRNA synthetase